MARFVPDNRTQRWVIISPARNDRPTIAQKPNVYHVCPFCFGNEKETPPEVYRFGSGEPNTPGWDVRVVPNKYPITDIHEVIIHSPSCTDDVDILPVSQVQKIFSVYRDRYRTHEMDGQVLIFCNHGASAGASLKHPHSQLVVVPNQINLDALSIEPFKNIVEEYPLFVTYCPEFSQWPFETWIAPKTEGKKFSDVVDAELPELANVVSRTLRKMSFVLKSPELLFKQVNEPFVFNYYIFHGKNWFIRIIPRSIHRAGFELGTGLNVNVVDPTDAARMLKQTQT
ncbi:MAG: DUF4931 domain-containing protein [Candidatus Gottesmanbacteria bacterium]